MATEFTENDKPDLEKSGSTPTALAPAGDPHHAAGRVVQPLRLLEARISEVQSRWHAVEEQLNAKDQTIVQLRADLAARAAVIEQLENTLADATAARASADDANAASQAELSHIESQLIQQSETLARYQHKLNAATAQYQTLEQDLAAAHQEVDDLRTELAAHQEALAAKSGLPGDLLTGDVEHAVSHLENFINAREQGEPRQNSRWLDFAESLAELESRLEQQTALLEEREALAASLGIANTELESRCDDREATIQQLNQKLKRRIEELETARADATGLQSRLENLQETVETQVLRIENLEADLARRDQTIGELEEALENQSRFSAELGSQLKQQAERVADAEARLAEKVDAARTLDAQLEALQERVNNAEKQLAERDATIGSLERTVANTNRALKAATRNLERAVADAETLRKELREARELTVELEHTVAASRLDREVFEAELGAQQLLIAELEQDLEKQQRTVALLDSSVERITTIAASLANLDQQMTFAEPGDSASADEPVDEFVGPYPVLVGNGGVFPLDKPVVTIGRSKKNRIHLQSLFTSRFHARIVVRPWGEVIIDDLASRNGVRVNGEKVSRRTLRHEDKIWIGEREFTFLETAGA